MVCWVSQEVHEYIRMQREGSNIGRARAEEIFAIENLFKTGDGIGNVVSNTMSRAVERKELELFVGKLLAFDS
jgi:hypothetical protein